MDTLVGPLAIAVSAGLLGYLAWSYADYRRMRGGRWW